MVSELHRSSGGMIVGFGQGLDGFSHSTGQGNCPDWLKSQFLSGYFFMNDNVHLVD